jgi:Restriction endonuclease
LLLSTAEQTIVCQCKKWSSSVGSGEVRKTLGGMDHYGAQRAIVVTTSDFTRDARALENTSRCELIDREKLRQMLSDLRERKSDTIATLCDRERIELLKERQTGHSGAAVAMSVFVVSLILANIFVGLGPNVIASWASDSGGNQDNSRLIGSSNSSQTFRYLNSSPAATFAASTPIEHDADLSRLEPADAEYHCLKDSPVFESPAKSVRVVAQVHQGKGIHVIGFTDNFLRIKMRDGTVGFVPKEIAEYKEAWIHLDK